MQVAPKEPSLEFSGLLYRPDAEVAVYLVMGLLWNHLPVRFAMDRFELDPKREQHTHTKYLDAKGLMLIDGAWQQVTFEFKLFSSGFLRDVQCHPGVKADVLVCWIHDAPETNQYVRKVIDLESVYRSLPLEQQEKIILNPDIVRVRSHPKGTLDDILARFAECNRPKIQYLMSQWPHVEPSRSELQFRHGAKTVFRACAYTSNHLISSSLPPTVSQEALVKRFNGKTLKSSVRIPLTPLSNADIDDFIRLLKEKGI